MRSHYRIIIPMNQKMEFISRYSALHKMQVIHRQRAAKLAVKIFGRTLFTGKWLAALPW